MGVSLSGCDKYMQMRVLINHQIDVNYLLHFREMLDHGKIISWNIQWLFELWWYQWNITAAYRKSLNSWWRHPIRTFFRVTDPLCGDITGHRWIPHTMVSDADLGFFIIYIWIKAWVNNREAGDLRHHRAHCDAIVICMLHFWVLPLHSILPPYIYKLSLCFAVLRILFPAEISVSLNIQNDPKYMQMSREPCIMTIDLLGFDMDFS